MYHKPSPLPDAHIGPVPCFDAPPAAPMPTPEAAPTNLGPEALVAELDGHYAIALADARARAATPVGRGTIARLNALFAEAAMLCTALRDPPRLPQPLPATVWLAAPDLLSAAARRPPCRPLLPRPPPPLCRQGGLRMSPLSLRRQRLAVGLGPQIELLLARLTDLPLRRRAGPLPRDLREESRHLLRDLRTVLAGGPPMTLPPDATATALLDVLIAARHALPALLAHHDLPLLTDDDPPF